jgi:pentapeptide MXKDX repeat protein
MEPKPAVFIFPGLLIQQEAKMRNLLIVACCAALMGTVSVASAQTAGPTTQDSMKARHPMDANAKMKHTKKKSMKSNDGMKTDTPKDTMKKDNMSK